MSKHAAQLEAKSIHWSRTTDAEFPYKATVEGRLLRLRINDFPAEPYFTVMEGGNELLNIEGWTEGWPPTWTRDKP